MKTISIRVVWGCMAVVLACSIPVVASAQTRTLRIVSYNIEDDVGATAPLPGLIAPSSTGSLTSGGVLEGIGEEILAGNSQPIDVLALQETTNATLTVQPILDGLNGFYSSHAISARYAMSSLVLTTTGGSGGGPSAMVYNTNTLQLLASVGVGTTSGSGQARQVGRYLFAPAGVATNASNTFYVYVSHAKSGTGTSNANRRAIEAGNMRTNSATLPANSRVLYVGDFNDSTSSEQMYQTLVGAGTGIPGVDPVNPSGASGINWGTSTSDTNILKVLTESATNLRYRDDYQMLSSNVFYGVGTGLALVSGTCHVFGNNGGTAYNGSVGSGNTALNANLNTNNVGITASQLYSYLTTASDHLPVVADYTIPVPGTAPAASFTGSPTNGVAPLSVTFTDTSTGSITNRFWDFGDGSTTNVTTNSVTHTYAAGTYNVMLVVSGTDGVSTNTKPSYITATVAPPTASFSGAPTNGTAPLLVTFTDASTGSITNRFWDFGDGNTTNFTGATNPTHTYAAGTYNVILIVSGSGGSSTNTKSGYITATAAAPVASFSGSPTSGTEPLAVTFTDTSTGSITGRFWDFGDGGTTNITTNSVVHMYSAGTNTVTLAVTGPGGVSTNTKPSYIMVFTAFQSWQIQYFGSTANTAAAATADPDGDGVSNLQEYLAGTDPTNNASFFGVTAVAQEGGDLRITWRTAGGRTNIVQVTSGDADSNYSTNDFADILGSQTIATGSGDVMTNYLDAGAATNGPSRFYRVRLVP